MNNKPNNKKMQPDTAASGDSSINTKKGFLISLPSRKKKNSVEPGSGIVMAKSTVDSAAENAKPHFAKPNNRNTPYDKSAKETRKASKEPGKNAFAADSKEKNVSERFKNAGAPSQERPQKSSPGHSVSSDAFSGSTGGNHVTHSNTGAKNPPRPDRSGLPKNKGKDRNAHDMRDAKAPLSKSSDRNTQNGSHPVNASNERPVKASSKNNSRGKNAKNASNNANVPNGQNGQSSPNDRTPKKQNAPLASGAPHKNRDRRTPKMPSLSPLSGDMMSLSRNAKNDFGSSSSKKAEREPSLEEKYKNAVPLAEQIAAEEQQRLARSRKKALAAVSSKPSAQELGETDAALTAESSENLEENCEIVGIRFREAGKIYYFDPDGQSIPFGTPVIVETSRGAEYGYTAIANRMVPGGSVVAPLKKIKRIASASDTEKYQANKELEAEAWTVFKKKVAELNLAMNLVFVEYTFDNSKLLFYFTAETRIDFRELVKELAAIFRTRIELRQIGVRDEAKMLGGLGVCGRCVCCNSFLGDFAQVSIKMAKEQGLSLNSAKISGACGKLMCCLRYEDKVYSEETARTPKIGTVVETAEGKGTVVETNPLKGEIKVSLENAPDTPPKTFDRDRVKVVGFREKAADDAAEHDAAFKEELLSDKPTELDE